MEIQHAVLLDMTRITPAGREILIPPNNPSDGVRVAFIVENGAPIELLEFTDPNHSGRRYQKVPYAGT